MGLYPGRMPRIHRDREDIRAPFHRSPVFGDTAAIDGRRRANPVGIMSRAPQSIIRKAKPSRAEESAAMEREAKKSNGDGTPTVAK